MPAIPLKYHILLWSGMHDQKSNTILEPLVCCLYPQHFSYLKILNIWVEVGWGSSCLRAGFKRWHLIWFQIWLPKSPHTKIQEYIAPKGCNCSCYTCLWLLRSLTAVCQAFHIATPPQLVKYSWWHYAKFVYLHLDWWSVKNWWVLCVLVSS